MYCLILYALFQNISLKCIPYFSGFKFGQRILLGDGFKPDIKRKRGKQSEIVSNRGMGFYPSMNFNPAKYGSISNFGNDPAVE